MSFVNCYFLNPFYSIRFVFQVLQKYHICSNSFFCKNVQNTCQNTNAFLRLFLNSIPTTTSTDNTYISYFCKSHVCVCVCINVWFSISFISPSNFYYKSIQRIKSNDFTIQKEKKIKKLSTRSSNTLIHNSCITACQVKNTFLNLQCEMHFAFRNSHSDANNHGAHYRNLPLILEMTHKRSNIRLLVLDQNNVCYIS